MKAAKEVPVEPAQELATEPAQDAPVKDAGDVIANDEHAGIGGSYVFDPVTGTRTKVQDE